MGVKADRISGFFWLFFSIFIAIEAKRLGLGTLHKPGPGFLYFWTSIALGIMSIIILIRAWTNKVEPGETIFGKQNLSKIFSVLIAVFLYAFFMDHLGFIPITLLLFIYLLGVIEKKKWYFTIFVSVIVTAAAYLIFEIWLKSQLPRGLLGSLRF
jgi:putative tricarboxylic transport membrane protein